MSICLQWVQALCVCVCVCVCVCERERERETVGEGRVVEHEMERGLEGKLF